MQHYKDSRRFLEKQKHTDFKAIWKGFAFVATNNFSEWTVKTSYLRNDYRAEKIYEDGHTVGTATIDENSALVHIQIDDPFRRMGLATKLISFINKTCPQFHVYAGVQNNSRYRLTEEGAKLINACQRKNILDDEKVILNTVPPSPHMTSPR